MGRDTEMVLARGYRLHQWGGALAWEQFDVPSPGPGEVLVEVEACGIGLTVLNTLRGDLANDSALLPRVPGHELVGRVRKTGSGVDGLMHGQCVMAYFYLACGNCRPCRAGEDSLCRNLAGWVGIHRDGGYATHAVLPARNLLPVPDGISAVDATTIPDAIATPYHVCQRRARIRPGDRVAVIGAGGGVGVHMIQMARLCGGSVLGLEIDEEKFATISTLGATPVQSATFSTLTVDRYWHGAKPTVVIDLVGTPESLAWGMEALATGGRMVVLTTFRDIHFAVSPRDLVFREIDLLGSRYASKADLLAAAELVASGAIQPIVGKVTSPEGVEAVHAQLRAGTLLGRGALAWTEEALPDGSPTQFPLSVAQDVPGVEELQHEPDLSDAANS